MKNCLTLTSNSNYSSSNNISALTLHVWNVFQVFKVTFQMTVAQNCWNINFYILISYILGFSLLKNNSVVERLKYHLLIHFINIITSPLSALLFNQVSSSINLLKMSFPKTVLIILPVPPLTWCFLKYFITPFQTLGNVLYFLPPSPS